MNKETLAPQNIHHSGEMQNASAHNARRNSVFFEDDTPVISLIGWSGSGKTTFFEKVVTCLRESGFRVGVIKHHAHDTSIDIEGKDSWRYCQAGASPVIVSSPVEFSVLRRPLKEQTLAQLVDCIADECDIILTEGYRTQAQHVIEFMRSSYCNDAIFDPITLDALVTDDKAAADAAHAVGTPVFSLEDAKGVAQFIVQGKVQDIT